MPRDMSRKEFHAALRRRGWRQVLLWIEIPPAPASIGMLMDRRTGKTLYRASLAYAIRQFEKHEKANQQ